MDRYKRSKRDNMATKKQWRRPPRSFDDAYRLDRPTLYQAIQLYTDVSHVLIQYPQRLTGAALVASFGVVGSVRDEKEPTSYLHRFLSLWMWKELLSSRVVDARLTIDRALMIEVDRCHLLHGLLSALLDPQSWTTETALLPSLLPVVLTHPTFRLYQQPPIEVDTTCSTVDQLRAHRVQVIERLMRGIGALYKTKPSDLLRDVFPSLLTDLATYHDRLFIPSPGRPQPRPNELDPASGAYIELIYHFLTSLFLHCLPLLHPRHVNDPVPLDGVLTKFFEQVIPASAQVQLATGRVHQEMALRSWPALLFGVDQLHIDPTGNSLPVSIRALVALTKRWPNVRQHSHTQHDLFTPLCACSHRVLASLFL
jgi:hypothetical protein